MVSLTALVTQILALSDGEAKWSKSIGLDKDLSAIGFGTRTDRYALVLDDLNVKYLGEVVHPVRELNFEAGLRE